MKMDQETEFLKGLIELQYGLDVEKKLRKISRDIPWASNWPEDIASFWNAEAFMWSHKISKEKRALLQQELTSLSSGKNVDLGCGAYSYLPSVGFDISEKMLLLNDNCKEKIVGDLEKGLPFKDYSFNSATAIFVLNYVRKYSALLKEIKRVLKPGGVFAAVLSAGEINEWQKQKEVNPFPSGKWLDVLQSAGFTVDFYEKQGLWFFRCRN